VDVSTTTSLLDDHPAPDTFHRRWLWRYGAQREGDVRVVCVPCAGHGASMYAGWVSQLPRGVELWALQPPGRENRLHENAIDDFATLVEASADALDHLLDDRPFVLVGHSMGALIAFELTRELRRRGRPLPRRLVVSGHPAPQTGLTRPPRCHLPDPMFLPSIRGLNAARAQDDEYMDVMRMMLPTLRADFALCERYVYRDQPLLPCDLSVWGGDDDPEAGLPLLLGWREQTTAEFSLRMFSGDHFFLMTQKRAVLHALTSALAPLVAATAARRSHRPD
jgi:surfactin synthase thioesterase subunit